MAVHTSAGTVQVPVHSTCASTLARPTAFATLSKGPFRRVCEIPRLSLDALSCEPRKNVAARHAVDGSDRVTGFRRRSLSITDGAKYNGKPDTTLA